nr:MAG TPA: hypothetical protein [Caudoviricetes sp.]
MTCGRRWCSWLVRRLSGWTLLPLPPRWGLGFLAGLLGLVRMGRFAWRLASRGTW